MKGYNDLIEITKGVARGLYPILLSKPGSIRDALDDIMSYADSINNTYATRMRLMGIMLETALDSRDGLTSV